MTKIALLLSPGFADWEYALIAGTGGPFYGLDIRFFAPDPGKLTSQGGLVCDVAAGLEDLEQWDPEIVVVVGGMIWETSSAPDLRALLQHQTQKGGAVAAICGGTLALARAGILDGVSHTSNSAEFLQSAEAYQGRTRYVDSSRAVEDNRIVTAPGTAPVTFTAEVFRLAGLDNDTISQFREMMVREH